MTLTVLSAGPLTLIQDGGRPHAGSLGVSPSGAFDRWSMSQANRLLGNDDEAPALEILGGGFAARSDGPLTVAVTGGVGPFLIDGDPVAHGRAIRLRAGSTLRIEALAAGLRCYLAVSGGFDAPRTLGSASTDVLSGLGPAPVQAGDPLPVGISRPAPEHVDVPSLLRTREVSLGVIAGPRDDWFSPYALAHLLNAPWHVSTSSNRIGVRLKGPRLTRQRIEQLPSEPCVRGSIQVAADGQPIVFGPDHPVTGGYPVIAVVADADIDRLGQARPGDTVRFSRRMS